MRSRAAVQHRPSVMEASSWRRGRLGSTKALVNRYDVGVAGLEPAASSL
jgi:hypothetical protein